MIGTSTEAACAALGLALPGDRAKYGPLVELLPGQVKRPDGAAWFPPVPWRLDGARSCRKASFGGEPRYAVLLAVSRPCSACGRRFGGYVSLQTLAGYYLALALGEPYGGRKGGRPSIFGLVRCPACRKKMEALRKARPEEWAREKRRQKQTRYRARLAARAADVVK